MTVSKVFLIDAAGLTGPYRVASFLGLGISPIGIGYLYQRLLLKPRPRGRGYPKDIDLLGPLLALTCQVEKGRGLLCPGSSDIDLLSDCESVVDLDPKISNCTFDLRVAKQS